MKHRRSTRALIACGIAALVLSGCGGTSDSGGSSASTAATSPAGQTTPSSASAGGSGSSSPTSASGTDAATVFAEFATRPTSIGMTEPITAPIPTGKTIGFIDCGASICKQEAQIMGEAGQILGWTIKPYLTDGSVQQVQNAFQQALNDNVDGLVYAGTPQSAVAKYLKEAEDKGVKVVSIATSEGATNGVLNVIAGPETEDPGKVWASFIGADSGGTGKALYATIPDFPINLARDASLEKNMPLLCPGCSYETINISFTQSGKDAPSLITSYLRSHPDVKYVIQATDFLGIGLPAALKAAGLNDIKIIGLGPDTVNLGYIAAGQQAMSVYFPLFEDTFAAADALARAFAGQPQVAWQPPVWALTKENLPSTDTLFPVVVDYKEQFSKIWGK
ncbi:substrate-binding domain-containing protein [Nakamurella sp. YIM 132087]|uniref:Substrate-binding domain-containing protein n=1 Tax=Nakamurella alba TaxID=2665158 RepID=A0A7K1FI43_9ACTN|nr:substrate-binding domain-containing protein [Nakamurella alba]MTD12554.1 substrate-binding domain-containing protein [Nakamurella alba]